MKVQNYLGNTAKAAPAYPRGVPAGEEPVLAGFSQEIYLAPPVLRRCGPCIGNPLNFLIFIKATLDGKKPNTVTIAHGAPEQRKHSVNLA
jgi:hypothetical protein